MMPSVSFYREPRCAGVAYATDCRASLPQACVCIHGRSLRRAVAGKPLLAIFLWRRVFPTPDAMSPYVAKLLAETDRRRRLRMDAIGNNPGWRSQQDREEAGF